MIENISGEKILVTGGTGFLGSNLIRRFVTESIKPIVLTRNAGVEIFDCEKSTLNCVEGDLLDTGFMKKFLTRFRPDIIIHLAGSTYQTDILRKINYEATVNLLESADSIGVKRFIMTGTADEYGFQSCPQIETMPTMPVSEYAVSKNKAVNYGLAMHKANGFPVVILRPFTIYGIGQPVKMFVAQAVQCAVRDIVFEMSKGIQKRDLLFVTDFVDAIIKTLTTKEIEGEVFNVASGKSITLGELAKKIWKIAGADEKLLKIGARQTVENELHNTEADVSKINQYLGWKPKISLDEGLKIVVGKAKEKCNER